MFPLKIHGENTLRLLSNVARTFAKHSALRANCPSRVDAVSWFCCLLDLLLCSWIICAISCPASSLKAAVTSWTRSTKFLVWSGEDVCLPSACEWIAFFGHKWIRRWHFLIKYAKLLTVSTAVVRRCKNLNVAAT